MGPEVGEGHQKPEEWDEGLVGIPEAYQDLGQTGRHNAG